MIRVLVTGVGGPAGRASAEFFRRGGFVVIGTDIAVTSTPVDSFRFVPRGDDSRFSSALLKLIARQHPDLLIPTVSEELPAIAAIKQQVLAAGTLLCVSDLPTILTANDKFLTAMALDAFGVPVPRTVPSSEVTGIEEAGSLLGYPFISKPRVGRGGRGVKVYRGVGDQFEGRAEDHVFQEFLPGEEYDVNLFAYPAGNVKAMAVLLKTSLRGGAVGNALAVRKVMDRDVAKLALLATQRLGCEGLIDIDIRRDRNGDPRIIEINARVGANVLSAKEVLMELRILLLKGILHHVSIPVVHL